MDLQGLAPRPTGLLPDGGSNPSTLPTQICLVLSDTCAFWKLNRPDALEVPWRLLKHHRHAEPSVGSTDNILLAIPVAPTIGPREFGPAPAARNAQVVGETPLCVDTDRAACLGKKRGGSSSSQRRNPAPQNFPSCPSLR